MEAPGSILERRQFQLDVSEVRRRSVEELGVPDGAEDGKTEVDSAVLLEWTPTTVGVIGACAAIAIVICVVAIVWFRSRRRHQKLLNDLTFDDAEDDLKVVKSAPASRSPSPKMSKRMSCPEALSTIQGGLTVRSGRIPDFSLPPERVQPYGQPTDQRPIINGHQRRNSFGSVQTELYHSPSYSEEDETHLPETANGRIWFSLLYDDAMEQLHVTLIKVKDLPSRDNNQFRDPFVKIFLLPDERTSRTSTSKKKTLSPVYNETHSFKVASDDVHNRVIRFSVYDVDKRRLFHSLGHVMINLRRLDLHSDDVMWSDLEPMAQAASSLGEIQISLAFYPQNEKIKMGILRARNLHHDVVDGKDIASFVRAQLYYGHRSHRLKATRLTRQRPDSSEHTFNDVLSFTVHGKQLEQCNLILTLVIVDPASSTEKQIGRVTIGPFMYARGDQLMHWQEMVSKPRTVTTRWHSLTMSNNPVSP